MRNSPPRFSAPLVVPLLGVLVFLTPVCVMAQATPAASLAGTWLFTVTTDAGGGTPTVTLTQRGDSLSGSYASETFGQQTLKGSVSNREFTLQFTTDAAGQSLTVVYKGTIESANALKGTVSFGAIGSGTFTAQRRAPSVSRVPDRGHLPTSFR
jgi:hypothetical protein